MRAAIIGTGFIGTVHARAVLVNGGSLTTVLASTPERTAAAATRLGAARPAADLESAVTADDVDIVHVCTPNDQHLAAVELALAAGKHVVCEKPLSTGTPEARRMLELVPPGRVAAVPFVYRFHPTAREARGRVADGTTGPVRLVHGSYLQDWLVDPGDTNWRVDPATGGPSRTFGDIGVHWCDLAEFVTGQRIVRLAARTLTAHAERAGRPSTTEDAVAIALETADGAVGTATVSQISPGRKNRLWLEVDGDAASVVFDQELPESLWIGRVGSAEIVHRGSAANRHGGRHNLVPVGHPQGYQDCFDLFVADVFAAARGHDPDGLPTFSDGVRAAVLTEAVLESSRRGSWVEVPA